MQIFIHCKTTLHVSDVTAPIIRSIKNCSFAVNKYLHTVASVGFLFTVISLVLRLITDVRIPEDGPLRAETCNGIRYGIKCKG